jgi:uncharacterized protein (DUF488 family)
VEIASVGHSNLSAEALCALLARGGIEQVADVRRFPVSRRFPQHGKARLEASLAAAGIGYAFLGEALGGRREPVVPPERSRNAALREPAFRAYADALDSPETRAGLESLERLARQKRTALLCAERDWRSCHRRILADALALRGWRVVHLLPGGPEPHELDPRARSDGGLHYPALL